jgi:hypothetical protein
VATEWRRKAAATARAMPPNEMARQTRRYFHDGT